MTDISTWEVLVDNREPDSTIEKVKVFFPSAKKIKLDVGDIFFKSVAIELKSFQDFIQTIMDKRFRNQLYNFSINKDIEGYYIIYGNWHDINKYSKININAIIGAMSSIEARYGLRLNIFPNKDYAIYYSSKIIEKSFDKKIIKPTTFRITTDDKAINMIMDGAERLQEKGVIKALEYFGSVKNIINSTPKKLQNIKNIGKVTAERFFETVNYDFKQKKIFENDFDIDFDIKNDKIEDKTEKKIEKLKPLDVDIFDSEYDGNDALKEILLQAILLYENKKGKGIPLNNLLKGVKKPKEDIKQALNDMEHENSIYQEDNFVYRSY